MVTEETKAGEEAEAVKVAKGEKAVAAAAEAVEKIKAIAREEFYIERKYDGSEAVVDPVALLEFLQAWDDIVDAAREGKDPTFNCIECKKPVDVLLVTCSECNAPTATPPADDFSMLDATKPPAQKPTTGGAGKGKGSKPGKKKS